MGEQVVEVLGWPPGRGEGGAWGSRRRTQSPGMVIFFHLFPLGFQLRILNIAILFNAAAIRVFGKILLFRNDTLRLHPIISSAHLSIASDKTHSPDTCLA